MKKIIILAISAILVANVSAQEQKKECASKVSKEERVEFEIKRLTNELMLSDLQAEKFAPLYREYAGKVDEIFHKNGDCPKHEQGTELTDAELDKLAKQRLEKQKELETRREYMSKLIEEIVKGSKIDLADEIVENQVESRKEDMVKRIQQSGLQLEQYLQILGQSEEQFTAQIREQALKETTEYVVLEEIGKAENLEVSDADLEFEFAKIAEQYHMTVEEVKKALNKNLEEFRHNIKMQRIDDFLYNQNN